MKDGSSNIRTGMFIITFTLENSQSRVHEQLILFVIDPPIKTDEDNISDLKDLPANESNENAIEVEITNETSLIN